jgi:hypothetical protein
MELANNCCRASDKNYEISEKLATSSNPQSNVARVSMTPSRCNAIRSASLAFSRPAVSVTMSSRLPLNARIRGRAYLASIKPASHRLYCCGQTRWCGLSLRSTSAKHRQRFENEQIEQHEAMPFCLQPGRELDGAQVLRIVGVEECNDHLRVELLGIGILHLTLIWNGDILTEYAVAGFLGLPLLYCRRSLLPIALLLFAVFVAPVSYPGWFGSRELECQVSRRARSLRPVPRLDSWPSAEQGPRHAWARKHDPLRTAPGR